MRKFRFTLVIAAVAISSAAAVSRAADRFPQTQAKINAMLAQRLKPAPLPPVLPNPFMVTNTTKPTEPGIPPVNVPDSDESVLARFAAGLKINGVFVIGGTPHLSINTSTYKEGDSIPIKDTEPQQYVRIVKILPTRELELSYNSAVLTMPLPN